MLTSPPLALRSYTELLYSCSISLLTRQLKPSTPLPTTKTESKEHFTKIFFVNPDLNTP
eukprot:m.13304 g.13304  ORF g.13304 m.13304 type:complete len:59 (-) comp10141_c0_seq1:174-350(-)